MLDFVHSVVGSVLGRYLSFSGLLGLCPGERGILEPGEVTAHDRRILVLRRRDFVGDVYLPFYLFICFVLVSCPFVGAPWHS